MRTRCPACGQTMDAEHFAGHYGRKVELDLCHHCNALWFDRMENLALTAGGVLALLQSMQAHYADDRVPMPKLKHCPRCESTLEQSRRRTKAIQYTVFDCVHGHGHFITFYELLREKDCIRPLRGEKLKALRKQLDVVACSSCGAPVDLHKTAACTHCSAPLALLDPDAMAETLERLAAEDDRQRNPDADKIAADMVLQRLRTESTFSKHDAIDARTWGRSRSGGLIEWGLDALLTWLF